MSLLDRFKSKKSAEEADYLEELKAKEQSERTPESTHTTELIRQYQSEKVPVRGRMFVDDPKYDIAYSYEKPVGAIEKFGGKIKSGIDYAKESQIGQYAGARAKGIVEFVPKRFEEARADYLASEEARQTKKATKIAIKKHTPTTQDRATKEEETEYKNKMRNEKIKYLKSIGRDLESNIKRNVAKDYESARAKSLGRLDARAEFSRKRQEQLAYQQMIQSGQVQRQGRKWPSPIYDQRPMRQATGYELDRMGIFTLGRYPSDPRNQQQQPRYNPSGMNALLGFNPNIIPQQAPQRQLQQVQTNVQPVQQANTNNFVNQMLGFSGTQSKPMSQTNVKVNNHKRNNKRKKVFNMFIGTWE